MATKIKQLTEYVSKEFAKEFRIVLLGTGNNNSERRQSSALIKYIGYNILLDCPEDFKDEIGNMNLDVAIFSSSSPNSIGGIKYLPKNEKLTCFMGRETAKVVKGGDEELSHLAIKIFQPRKNFDIFGITVLPLPIGDGCGFKFGNGLIYVSDLSLPLGNNIIRQFNETDTIIVGSSHWDV
jgi:hypothetical protein